MKQLRLVAPLLLGLVWPLQAANYKIDPDHSTVGFKIRHLAGKVSGRFDKFEGTFVYDKANPKVWKAQATIDAAGINTNNAKRDDHLRTPDFFDVKTYPTLSFVSTKVSDVQGSKAKLHGQLSIHGVTKPVVLDLEMLGEGKDPWGNERGAFVATTTINRADYGLTWNKAIETGGFLVGEDVEITLDMEGVKEK